jgi:hypothetical protein
VKLSITNQTKEKETMSTIQTATTVSVVESKRPYSKQGRGKSPQHPCGNCGCARYKPCGCPKK